MSNKDKAKSALVEIIKEKGLPLATSYYDGSTHFILVISPDGVCETGQSKGKKLAELGLIELAQLAEFGSTDAEVIEDLKEE